MDCNTARFLVAFCRPNVPELEPCAAEALSSHLAECSECGTLARTEHHAERRLGHAMREVPLPVNLRERLLTRLQEDRRTWYRRLPRRHPRAAAAIAALLLVAVGLAGYALLRPPRALDLEAIAYQWNREVPASPDEVQKAFEERGFKIIVPSAFNYEYLASYDLQEFHGTVVPHLLFVRGAHYASIYILSGSQFDIRAAVDQPREGSGRFTVQLRPGPADSNLAYLIKYTDGSLDWFLEEEKRSST